MFTLKAEASLLPFVGIHCLLMVTHGTYGLCWSWLTANEWFLGDLLWYVDNTFYFRCSQISEFIWWARPLMSDFDGGSCSFKCLKLLNYTFLPYVINIWGLIEKQSHSMQGLRQVAIFIFLFPVFFAAVILVCKGWVETMQLKKIHKFPSFLFISGCLRRLSF